jgi:hypothetical protein
MEDRMEYERFIDILAEIIYEVISKDNEQEK